MALPARFQYVAQQEHAGELEAVLQILIRPDSGILLVWAKERRQPQEPVAPGFARATGHRTTGFRRDVDQIGGFTGRSAAFEIEPETELTKHGEFEARS